MKLESNDQSDLAAALFHLLGAAVPYSDRDEEKARELYETLPTKEKRLQKVISLCGTPETPRQYYLLAKAYSWLGADHRKEAIRWASAYLDSDGWDALPDRIVSEDGILVSQAAMHRAELYDILAQAQDEEGRHEAALANFSEAYRLEPYNALNAIKMADVIAQHRSRQEALNFLIQQKSSRYYRPIHYQDAQGGRFTNDTFQRLLDAHILKLEHAEKEGHAPAGAQNQIKEPEA